MNIKEIVIKCLEDESKAIKNLCKLVDNNIVKAVDLIFNCKGRLIITGIGKSGHVGAKIAATFASTGTPSFFLDPIDALHGDLGMIVDGDIIMIISNSGQTDELLRIIPFLKSRNIPIISMTGNANSLLAKYANFNINIHVEREACPMNLVPTSSTTAAIAMGDALVLSLMEKRKFREIDYARFHPAGSLGKKMLMKVKDLMYTNNLPVINKYDTITNMLVIMAKGKLGIAIILENKKIIGLITNGDLRRGIEKEKNNIFDINIVKIMNPNPIVIYEDEQLSKADELFKKKKLNILLVINSEGYFVGILDIREM